MFQFCACSEAKEEVGIKSRAVRMDSVSSPVSIETVTWECERSQSILPFRAINAHWNLLAEPVRDLLRRWGVSLDTIVSNNGAHIQTESSKKTPFDELMTINRFLVDLSSPSSPSAGGTKGMTRRPHQSIQLIHLSEDPFGEIGCNHTLTRNKSYCRGRNESF